MFLDDIEGASFGTCGGVWMVSESVAVAVILADSWWQGTMVLEGKGTSLS